MRLRLPPQLMQLILHLRELLPLLVNLPSLQLLLQLLLLDLLLGASSTR